MGSYDHHTKYQRVENTFFIFNREVSRFLEDLCHVTVELFDFFLKLLLTKFEIVQAQNNHFIAAGPLVLPTTEPPR